MFAETHKAGKSVENQAIWKSHPYGNAKWYRLFAGHHGKLSNTYNI